MCFLDECLNTPTSALVQLADTFWRINEERWRYRLQESILKNVFERYSTNNLFNKVLIKVTLLNQYYSTHITNVHKLAEHVFNIQDLDERIMSNAIDFDLVDEIGNVQLGKVPRFHYSFATKYCSFHNPRVYPIYDKFAAQALAYYNTRGRLFGDFSYTSLIRERNYQEYCNFYRSFIDYFNLRNFSLKQIDRLLWQTGKIIHLRKGNAK